MQAVLAASPYEEAVRLARIPLRVHPVSSNHWGILSSAGLRDAIAWELEREVPSAPDGKAGHDTAAAASASAPSGSADWKLTAPEEIRPLLYHGCRLVARDCVGEWIEARIARLLPDRHAVTVRFKGWGKKYNEVIGIADGRLRPMPARASAAEAEKNAAGPQSNELKKLAFLSPGLRSVTAEVGPLARLCSALFRAPLVHPLLGHPRPPPLTPPSPCHSK